MLSAGRGSPGALEPVAGLWRGLKDVELPSAVLTAPQWLFSLSGLLWPYPGCDQGLLQADCSGHPMFWLFNSKGNKKAAKSTFLGHPCGLISPGAIRDAGRGESKCGFT